MNTVNEPSKIAIDRTDLAEALMEIYDHGWKPNAFAEADVLIEKLNLKDIDDVREEAYNIGWEDGYSGANQVHAARALGAQAIDRDKAVEVMVNHVQSVIGKGTAGVYVRLVPAHLNYQRDWPMVAALDALLASGILGSVIDQNDTQA